MKITERKTKVEHLGDYQFITMTDIYEEGQSFKHYRVVKESENEYAPSIYVELDIMKNVYEVKISTSSYGALSIEEMEKYSKAYLSAIETAKQIEKMLAEEEK